MGMPTSLASRTFFGIYIVFIRLYIRNRSSPRPSSGYAHFAGQSDFLQVVAALVVLDGLFRRVEWHVARTAVHPGPGVIHLF